MKIIRKKKQDPNRLLDLRVILLRDDHDLLAWMHEDAKRNERTMPRQVRFMLRRAMAMENTDAR